MFTVVVFMVPAQLGCRPEICRLEIARNREESNGLTTHTRQPEDSWPAMAAAQKSVGWFCGFRATTEVSKFLQ